MKKLLILASLFIAIASYGGSTILAHAQSLTPQQTAALQQQLDDAKAKLVQLQMQQGQVPAGDSSLPTTGATATAPATPAPTMTSMTLSAADIASINTALNGLKTALLTIQAEVNANPQLVASNSAGVVSALQGIGATLATINNEVQNGSVAMTAPTIPQNSGAGSAAGTGVAQVNPSTGSAGSVGSAGSTGSTNPAGSGIAAITPSTQQPTVAPTTQNTMPATQTAQASSAFSFSKLNWPLIIVIILIVAAIAIWLWWDDSEEKPKVRTVTIKSQQPLQMSNQPSSQTSNSSDMSASAPTPLSSAIGPQQKKTA